MNRIMMALCFALLFCLDMSGEQISKTVTRDKSNVCITTLEFKNESDGKIKAILFGDDPNFSDKIIYYDNTNSDYFEHEEQHNILYDDTHPKGQIKTRIIYLRSNPDQIERIEYYTDNLILTSKRYYLPGNKKNLLYKIVLTLMGEKYISIQEVYQDPKKAVMNVRDQIAYYDDNGEVIQRIIHYAENQYYMREKVIQYDPPVFSHKEKKPKEMRIEYLNHPDGLLRENTLYDDKGWSLEMKYFDPSHTEDNFTEIRSFYDEKDILRRQDRYFDEKLYRGKVYFFSQLLNDDGTVKSTQYYDKDEKVIKREEL